MMRGVLQTLALGAGLGSLVMLLAACGGTVRSGDNSSTTTQETYGVSTPDPPPKQNTEWDRLSAHQGSILASVHIRVVYVGTENEGLAPNQDEFMKWLVTSEYWGTLKQYGIGNGTILDSVSVPREELAPTALLQPDKLIAVQDLDLRVGVMVNGSATEAPYPGVAGADGYVIFLPDGLNVELSHRADYTSTTCIDEGGYHAHDGTEPYVIVPPCDKGRSTVAISHEITEMVTDPLPAAGWLSDGDVSKNGGEIADLCNHSIQVESRDVTQLWSNSDGECMPYEP
jgi:hypothetical protein